jgi:hypothetical protein
MSTPALLGIAAAAASAAFLFSRRLGPEVAPPGIGERAVFDRRAAVARLVSVYLPCVDGDAHFAEIAADYGHVGTTCGYLPGWALARLRCTDGNLVNRTDPELGLTYHVGENLSRLVNGAKALGIFRTLAGGALPGACDFGYFALEAPRTRADGSKDWGEHVDVILEYSPTILRSADMGRTDPATGRQAGELVTRSHDGAGAIQFTNGPKRLIGWVDLDGVPLGAPPYDCTDWTLANV